MWGACFQMGLCGHVQDRERVMAREERWAVRRRGRAHRHTMDLWEYYGGGFLFLEEQLKDLSFFPSTKQGEQNVMTVQLEGEKKDKKVKETLLKDGQDG